MSSDRWLTLAACLCVCGAILDGGIHPASANGPAIGISGNSIFPLVNQDVQLVSEKVVGSISEFDLLHIERNPVVCEYKLRNKTAKPITFDMAFAIGSWDAKEFVVEEGGQHLKVQRLAAMK